MILLNICKINLFFLILFLHIFFGCCLSSKPLEFRKQNSNYVLHNGYIYRFKDSEIKILDVNDYKNINIKCKIYEDGIENPNIYVSKNNLFVSGMKMKNGKSFLSISIYDISDKEIPIKVNDFEVSGESYIFKNKGSYIYLTVYEKEKCSIISLDLSRSKIHLKTQEFYCEEPEFVYLSCDDLYVVSRSIENKTKIHKFHVDSDVLTYVDKVSFDGEILNQGFINEHMDNLRIIVKQNSEENKLYIFNEELSLINSMDNFFNNENINKVYFCGNMCYVSGFSKKGSLISYDLNNLIEIQKLEIPISVNHIFKLSGEKALLVGSENRFDTYKNIYSDKVYELIKNVGLKILILENINNKDIKISKEYLVKGKYVYSSSFMDESQIIYLENENSLILPVDITDYNTDVDVSSAMEVSSNLYRNIVSNFKKIFSGLYIFDLGNDEEIILKSSIDNYRDLNFLDHEDIHHIEAYGNNIFIFTENLLKIFDLSGNFLGMKEI